MIKILDFILFIIIDTFIHILIVKWKVKTDKDLFIDLELRPLFKRNRNDK